MKKETIKAAEDMFPIDPDVEMEDSEHKVSMQAGFLEGVKYATRWIPVEERLPSVGWYYLVKCKTSYPKNCDVVVAEFYEDNQTFYSESSDFPIPDVVSWRPIEF